MEYNLDLSRRRAAAIVAALASDYGIAAARLQAHGLGELAPVDSNAPRVQPAAGDSVFWGDGAGGEIVR